MPTEKQQILFEMDDNLGDTIDRLSEMADGLLETHDALEDMAESGEMSMSTVQDAMDSLDTKNLRALEDVDFGHMVDGIAPGLRTIDDMQDTLRSGLEDYFKAKKKFEMEGTDAARKMAEESERAFRNQIRNVQQLQKKASQNLKHQAKEAKRVFVDQRQELHQYMEEEFPKKTGQEIGGAVKSALNADPQGMVMGVVGALKSGGEAAFKNAAQVLEEKKMKDGVFPDMEEGLEASIEGPDMGGEAEGTEEMAEAAGAMKGMTGTMTKMLGATMAAVGGVAMLVQLLMDAEKQTIELNESLLDNVSLYDLSNGNLEEGVQHMEDLRDAATDMSTQMRLGMEPDEIMKATGALREQHIDLNELAGEYQDMGTAATSVLQDIRFASLNLATDTQSVTEFVGNMHDVHAVSMNDMRQQLDLVVHSAGQADMATEEFFSTVNQISGQMGLYNFRLEDTTALMGELSHLMDAETAQEFAEEFTTGMKDMNSQERMRLMLLAGQEDTMQRLNDENERMFERAADTTGFSHAIQQAAEGTELEGMEIETVDDLKESVAEIGAESDEYAHFMSRLNDENSDLAENIDDAAQMAADIERGGLHTVDAMRHLQAMDHMDMEIKALENVAGPIGEIPNVMADSLGVDERQLEVMRRLDQEASGQLERLRSQEETMLRIDDSDERQRQLDELGEALGMQLSYDEEANEIQTAQGEELQERGDVMRNMSQEQIDEIEDEKMTLEDMARQQISETQSVGDIMQAIIADLLQDIAGGVTWISDLLVRMFGDESEHHFLQNIHEEQQNIGEERRALEEEMLEAQQDEDHERVAALEREMLDLDQRSAILDEGQRQVEEEGADAVDVAQAMRDGGELGLDFTRDADQLVGIREAESDVQDEHTNIDRLRQASWLMGPGTGAVVNMAAAGAESVAGGRQDPEDATEWAQDGLQNRRSIEIENAKEMAEDLLDDEDWEDLNQEEQEQLLGRVVQELENETELDPATIDDIASSTAQEHAREQRRQEQREQMMRAVDNWGQGGAGSFITPAQDARILSGGFAPHSFAPGDMIVKADEIADTQTGRAGEFAPDLFSGSGGSQSSGGKSINMSTTINVNGGNTDQVENAVLRAYDMIKRREMGES